MLCNVGCISNNAVKLSSLVYLDLQSGDVADGEAEKSGGRHRNPKSEAEDFRVVVDRGRLAEDDHERDEEEDRVDVVVKGEEPDAVVHFRQDSLDVDGVQRDEEGGKHAVDGSGNRQSS